MSFDTSRFTFKPSKNYNGVVMEQGRVQSDADWNEWLHELARRLQAGTVDTLGRAVYPPTTPFAFEINFDASGNLTIGPGRMYVDGLLAENFGDPKTVTWDPALAELSNTPQPPPSSETGAIAFEDQPYFSPSAPQAALPTGGTYLAYLDVWTRAVDYLEDSNLIDPAIGIDTTGRLQTVWQVWLGAVGAGVTCANAGNPWPPASRGRLSNAPINSTPGGPCCLTNNAGYTGRENQHYRVEVHKPGPLGTATIKWSRDNASVETGVTAITPVTNSVLAAASQLSVLSMGRDQVLGFAPGDWIELLDNDLELAGLPGELHRIDTIDFAGKTITLDSPAAVASFPVSGTNFQTDPARCTRIRRWDQSGKVFASDGVTVITDLGSPASTGDIPTPLAGTSIILESGITITLTTPTGGVFNTGDYWTFAARTDGTIESIDAAPPRGIHHHYVPLAIVDFGAGKVTSDCRVPWNPGGPSEESCGCCCITVGDGIESVGDYTSINDALNALPANGGEVCVLAGRYFEHVFINGLSNVVIRGCGYKTRIASPSLSPQAGQQPSQTAPGKFNAVISISRSRHIQLLSFAVEADTEEVGVLIDGTGRLAVDPSQSTNTPGAAADDPGRYTHLENFTLDAEMSLYLPIVIDVTVKDLFLTGSTLPAILARRVQLLRIDDNRILMENRRSLWPSVYVSGVEMHLDRNYVGIQSRATMTEWLPTTVIGDLESTDQLESATTQPSQPTLSTGTPSTPGVASNLKAATTSPKSAAASRKSISLTSPELLEAFNVFVANPVAMHQGGIMVAGPSQQVFLCENLIVGGRFNGITLGSYAVVDSGGLDTGTIVGVSTVDEGDCDTTGTLQPPGSTTTGTPGTSIVAGGELIDIVIDRNRISNMGLCGIGPVGIFDMIRVAEVISIHNLTITNNTIRDTVLRPVAALNTFGVAESAVASPSVSSDNQNFAGNTSSFTTSASAFSSINTGNSNPYAAICVPAVENLVIRDNAIENFGAKPGIGANGIFVLNGEMVDISRNQVIEKRDWASTTAEAAPASPTIHGGIVIAIVTPPLLPNSSSTVTNFVRAVHEPSLPALRVEENVVRVALGQALVVFGLGPFAISNNHFSCGGTVRGRGTAIAQTVLIVNLGAAIETLNSANMRGIYDQATGAATTSPYSFSNQGLASRVFELTSSGTVLFTNNICQLESRLDRQFSFSSIFIFTRDHLIYSGNHSWVDTTTYDAYVDALLAAGSLNVTSNRFQESPVSVLLSGVTVGVVNITSQNISTFCLLVEGLPNFTVDRDNLALIQMASPGLCTKLAGH